MLILYKRHIMTDSIFLSKQKPHTKEVLTAIKMYNTYKTS